MRYIGGDVREEGCIFCNRLAADNDVRSLVLHRSGHSFVIMNLYPYNTGHVMAVPNAHKANLDALDEPTLIDMATLLPKVVTSLRRVLNCDGFNIGLNLGADAGAGVAQHLHQHVVPRWEGDANFMPILAGTMVIPEVIPATYAKIRAELDRVLDGTSTFDIVVISDEERPAAWLRDGTIPTVSPDGDTPVWRAARAAIATEGAEIVGWSGASSTAGSERRPGLVLRTQGMPTSGDWHAVPLRAPGDDVDAETAATLARSRENLFPWIDAAEGHE
ncbi:MAG TPA: HIT domain-containing protein [Thermomicrobiales bacterium]|nr:HIT domain-containing protein [Thermomicrobiales bacterium]